MPRKEKEIRIAERRDARNKLERDSNNVPAYLQKRQFSKSSLAENIQEGTSFYNWKGFTETSDGELGLSYNHGEAANDIRHMTAEEMALKLHEHFEENFWNRKYTKIIADYAGVRPRTIRNYRKTILNINGKAK